MSENEKDSGNQDSGGHAQPVRLRSRSWFDDPAHADMSALYLERYTNFGFSVDELQSNRPVIGIAQTGSDLAPCNRHHLVLASRVKDGIREAGGIPLEFPVHPIQETGKRPTAALDRNLAYLGLVELLFGYPLDGVVLTTGCDKTVPAGLMAAATVNLPAIALSVGPMLNGWYEGQRVGSGTIVWEARQLLATGRIDRKEFMRMVVASTPSTGYCNTMGTAATMNSLAEALGMTLPGAAAIPAPHRDRQECAYHTGRQIVEMVAADRKPSDILTREAFINAIRVTSAIGGSTNAPIHLCALARHVGVELTIDDWQTFGFEVPLLVNLMPAGEYLAEDYYRAGGVPAVIGELMRHGLIYEQATTANGRTIGHNCGEARSLDERVIRSIERPLKRAAGFRVMRGNLFDSAILKTSVISDAFRARYLSNPADPDAFEGRAVVFDGPEDYHANIDNPALGIDDNALLVMRGAGPLGYPGSAEVVNMQPPAALIGAGVRELPCIGDGRQSGTSGSPSILNASPEAAAGGGLALLRTGDRIRIDLREGTANVLVSDEELAQRRRELDAAGGYPSPVSQTPWQELQRATVGQLQTGAVLEFAVKYQRLAQDPGRAAAQSLIASTAAAARAPSHGAQFRNERSKRVTAMPLNPQAALAIRIAGDLPANLSPVELRRAYSEQRVKMLPPAPPIAVVRDLSIPSPEGPIAARLYRSHDSGIACPLLVFFHGGGWMLGSVDSYDTVCRRLAIKGECAVLSVDYRLAPETTFPGAVNDAYAATLWAAKNAGELGIDVGAIAVGGDSAGGNLAAVLAQMSHDSGDFSVALQVLIYPCTDMSREYPSYVRNASGYMLTRAAMHWFISTYVPNPADRLDARASPLLRPSLAGLARALIIAAEFDPLVDDNEAYALRLQQAGVATRYEYFPGMHHPFFTLGAYIDDAAKAEDLIAAEMKGLVRNRVA